MSHVDIDKLKCFFNFSTEVKRNIIYISKKQQQQQFNQFDKTNLKIKFEDIKKIYYYHSFKISWAYEIFYLLMTLTNNDNNNIKKSKHNDNSNKIFVFIIGREFLLHPSHELSTFYSFIDAGNINIFINVLVSFLKNEKLYNIFRKNEITVNINNNNNNSNDKYKLLNLYSDIKHHLNKPQPYPLEGIVIIFLINNNNNNNVTLPFWREKKTFYYDLYMILRNLRLLKENGIMK